MDGHQRRAEADITAMDRDVQGASARSDAGGGDVRPISGGWLLAWLSAALSAWLLPWLLPWPGVASTAPVAWLDTLRQWLLALTPRSDLWPALALLALALLALALLPVVVFNLMVSAGDVRPGRIRCFRLRVFALRPWIQIAVLSLACLSGASWTLGHVSVFRQHALKLDQRLNRRLDLTVVGRVVGLPRMRDHHLRFALKVRRSYRSKAGQAGSSLTPGGLILLNRYGYPHGRGQWIKAGRRYRMSVRIEPPHGTVNPGGFDYQRWLFRHHYLATGYVRGAVEPLAGNGEAGWLDRLRADLRGHLIRAVHERLARGLLLGLTLGDRSDLPRADWSVLLATGTNHLLAISGLHVGMIAGLLALIAGAIWRRTRWCEGFPAQKVAALAALAVAWLYAAIAGLSIPTERAAIMLTVMLSGVLFSRRWRLFDLWLLAAMIILLIDPFAPLDAGFWLSFLAVLVIIVWVRHRPEAPLWRRLIELQLILTLALWPWVWGLFGRIAWASLPANLLAVPLVSWVITPLALLGLVWIPLSPGTGSLLAQAIGWLGQGLFAALAFLTAHMPDSRLAPPPVVWLALAMIGVMFLLLPRRWPGRGLGLILLLPALLYRPVPPAEGTAAVWLFDLGRGTACLVRTHRHALLYVRGPVANDRVAGALRTLDIDHLDRVESGHTTSRQRLRWQALVEALSARAPYWDDCGAGQRWYWDGVRFATRPVTADGGRACVLTVRDRYGSTLLGDDLDRNTALALAREGIGSADWLIVPHRGAQADSPLAFVHAVRPRAALIEAGFLNRYGDPDPATLARYRRVGAHVHVSGEDGTLLIRGGHVTDLRRRQWPFAWRGLLPLR